MCVYVFVCVCVCWGKWSRYAWKRWWLIQKAVAELRMLNNINWVGLVANDGCRLNLFMFFWACVLPPISFLSSLTLPSPLFSPLLSTFLLSYPLPCPTLLGREKVKSGTLVFPPLLSSLLFLFFSSLLSRHTRIFLCHYVCLPCILYFTLRARVCSANERLSDYAQILCICHCLTAGSVVQTLFFLWNVTSLYRKYHLPLTLNKCEYRVCLVWFKYQCWRITLLWKTSNLSVQYQHTHTHTHTHSHAHAHTHIHTHTHVHGLRYSSLFKKSHFLYFLNVPHPPFNKLHLVVPCHNSLFSPSVRGLLAQPLSFPNALLHSQTTGNGQSGRGLVSVGLKNGGIVLGFELALFWKSRGKQRPNVAQRGILLTYVDLCI